MFDGLKALCLCCSRRMLWLGMVVLVNAGCASFMASSTGSALAFTPKGVRTFAQVITDKSIERTAKINFYKLDNRFSYSRVNVKSFFGAVLLTGQVNDPYLRQLAEENVRHLANVVAVHNYLHVANNLSFSDIVQDGLITSNATANIARIADFKESRVSITTEEGAVYVMGQLTKEESTAVLEMLQRTPYIKKINMLVDVLQPPAPSLLPPLDDTVKAQVSALVAQNTPPPITAIAPKTVETNTTPPTAATPIGTIQTNSYQPLGDVTRQAPVTPKETTTDTVAFTPTYVSARANRSAVLLDEQATRSTAALLLSSAAPRTPPATDATHAVQNTVTNATASGASQDLQQSSSNASREVALPVVDSATMPFMPEIKPLQ